jgi:L-alanine-DL-glutamate epimerase-like enolase superfamily enzyme
MKISGNSIIDRQQHDPAVPEPGLKRTGGQLALSDKPCFGVELNEDRPKATRFA